MTTENIRDEAEAARKALGQVAQKAQQRSREVARKRKGLQQERDKLVIGARAAMRDIDDEDDVLDEEEQQLQEILEGPTIESLAEIKVPPAPADVPPEPAEVPVEEPSAPSPTPAPEGDEDVDDDVVHGLFDREELEDMSNEQLQKLANSYDLNLVVSDNNRAIVVVAIIGAQNIWCIENNVVNPVQSPRESANDRVFDVRSWSGVQWLFAILFAIIGVVVANLSKGMFDDISGFGRGVLVVLWFVFVTGFGFFFGGFVGSIAGDSNGEDNEGT